MDNYLFKKYQEKADNQLLLIEDRKLKIRKDLHMMYFLYLNRIRSEFFNYIRKAISSIEESKTTINLSKKEMQSLIANDINPLINEMMPFITIEQLTLTKYSFQNKSLKADHSPEKDLDLDVKSFYKKDNMTYLLNISSECKYYSFSEEYELNSSIDLDNFNFEKEELISYKYKGNYNVNNEKKINVGIYNFWRGNNILDVWYWFHLRHLSYKRLRVE